MITLTIIGVVAAMTVPTLLIKYKDQATVTKLKKAQAVLANAINLVRTEDGLTFDANNSTWGDFYSALFAKIKHDKNSENKYEADQYITEYVLSDDGIAYGAHFHDNKIFVMFDNYKKGNDYSSKDNGNWVFNIIDNRIIPEGIHGYPNDITRSTTCPSGTGCTYWTLKTGKIKKANGEWDASFEY